MCACLVIDVNLSLQYRVNTSLASRNRFSNFFHLSHAANEGGGKSSLIQGRRHFRTPDEKKKHLQNLDALYEINACAGFY